MSFLLRNRHKRGNVTGQRLLLKNMESKNEGRKSRYMERLRDISSSHSS